MMFLCSNTSFFVYCFAGQNFKNNNTFPEKVAFKLVAQSNNLENGKKKLDFFYYFFHIFLKSAAFPFYIFCTYHFGNKIIVSLSIAFHSIQHFSSMISNFHLLKFQISSMNTQCFKANILAQIKPK